MQHLVQSLLNERSPEKRIAPSSTHQQRGQSFAIGRFTLFALMLVTAEGVAMLLNAQSYKLAGVSLVWLPNGLLIGALLCSPKKQWPAYLVMGQAIDIAFNFGSGGSLATSIAYAAFNTLETVTAVTLLRRHLSLDPDLTQARQLRYFLLYGVIVAPLTAALSASLYLYLHDGTPFSQSARFWFAADMLGIATVTPLFLSYHHGRRLSCRSNGETAFEFTVLFCVVLVVFGLSTFPTLWIVLLALILLGVRAGFTASALGLLTVIALGGYLTINGRGPLGLTLNHSLADRTLFFQCFVAVSMVGLYITEVAMTANRAAQSGLREGEARYRSLADELEGRVAERTLELKQEIAEREVIQHHLINAKLLAEESNRTKSIFLANMSHELRTPLNAILGYSELLEEDAADRRDHSAVADLQRVQKAGRHLLTIINDVLDLSKIESGRMDLHCEDITIVRVVEEVAAHIHPLARQQNNTFTTFMADAETTVYVDVVKFRQCLLNLLSNACKFTENGIISLDILADHGPEGRSTRWIVKDTGIGIGTNDLSRLFQAFSQVDSSATRRHDGTGLGLAISRRLINMMGGEITVETERGQGSTFTILLPDARSARTASKGQRAASAVNHE